MKIKNFLEIFEFSAEDIFSNAKIFLPGIFLWFVMIAFSKLSVFVNQKINNTIMLTVWLAIFGLIIFLMMSFIFSGLIGMSNNALKKKYSLGDFYRNGKKFWFKNFFIMILILLISIIIWAIAHYGAMLIGNYLKLDLKIAVVIFFLIYFFGIIGIIIFFTFSSFYLVIFNLTIKESIKNSFKLVKKEYLPTLSLSAILFVILFLLNKIPVFVAEFLEYVVFVPFATQILTRFVYLCENKK